MTAAKPTPNWLIARRLFLAAVLLSILTTAWWFLGAHRVSGPLGEAFLTKLPTSVSLLLLGLVGLSKRPMARRSLGAAAALLLVFVVAGLSLALVISSRLGLLHPPGELVRVGQVSPLTAIGLFAGALALARPRKQDGIVLMQAFALVAVLVGLTTVMSYLYGAPLPTAGVFRGGLDASLPAGVAFLLIGLGATMQEADRGFVRHLTGNLPTQRATRRLAAAAVAIPVLGGWIGVVVIRAGIASPQLGVASVVALTFTVWGALLWTTGRKLTEIQLKEIAMQQELKDRVLARTLDLELAMRELDAFNHSVSHDLHAPIRNLRLQVQTIRADHDAALPHEARTLLADMERLVTDVQQKLNALVMLARASQDDLGRVAVDASGLAQEILTRLQAEDPSRTVRTTIQHSITAYADRALLSILLENLLNNAWKFTRDTREASIEFGLADHNGRRMYFVRDNGVGFGANDTSHLFRPFRRLHPGFPGSGIGLATCARIVRRHGGTIEASGAPGEGATFRFTLGKGDQLPAPSAEQGPSRPAPGRSNAASAPSV